MADINIKSDLSIGDVRISVSSEYSPSFRRSTPSDLYNSIQQFQQKNASIVDFQFPFDRPKYHMIMAIQTYSRQDAFTINANLDTGTRVILPIPSQLNDGHGVSYNDTNLGKIAGNMMQAGSGIMNDMKAGKGLEQTVGNAIKNNAGAIATGAATQAAQSVAPGAVGAVSALTGLSPNEFFTVLMQGPQYKRHSLTWHLVPRNFAEAIMIKKIIAVLNNAMAPGLEVGGALFNFPKVFQLALLPNYNYLYKYKPAVLERMQVNYSTGSAPSFYHSFSGNIEDSPPESVQISCSFLELEYWLASDFKDEALSPIDTRGEFREGNNPVINSVTPFAKAISDPNVLRQVPGNIADGVIGGGTAIINSLSSKENK